MDKKSKKNKRKNIISNIFAVFISFFVVVVIGYGFYVYEDLKHTNKKYEFIYKLDSPDDYARRVLAVEKKEDKSDIYASDIEITENGKSTNYFDLYYLNNEKKKIRLTELPDGMTFIIQSIIHSDPEGVAFFKGKIKHKDNYKLNASFNFMVTGFKEREKMFGIKEIDKSNN